MGHWLQPSFPPCDFLLAHLSVRAWLRPEFCRDAAPGNLINRILIDRSSSLAHAWSGQSARPRSGRLPDRMPTRANAMRGRMGRLALPTVAGARGYPGQSRAFWLARGAVLY